MAADKSNETKRIKGIIALARKAPLNFAACVGRDGAVLEADLRKSPAQLLKTVRKTSGSSNGAAGHMSVKGSTLLLTCDALPPSSLGKSLQSMLSQHGHSMTVRFGEAEEPTVASTPQAEPEEDAPDPGDDEDDIAAAAGDLTALLKAVLRKTYNFAFLFGNPSVLKGHKRHPAAKLVRAAKAEGAGPQGAWGQLNREGRLLIMTVENRPPPTAAKKARVFLRNAGHSLQVSIRTPEGDVLEDDLADLDDAALDGESVEDRMAATAARLEAILPMMPENDAKRAQSIATLMTTKLAGGEVVKSEQLLAMLEDLIAPHEEGAAPPAQDADTLLEGGPGDEPEGSIGALPVELDADMFEAFADDETWAISQFLEDENYVQTTRRRGPFFLRGIEREMTNDALTDHAYETFLRHKHGEEYTYDLFLRFKDEAGPLLDLTTGELLVITDNYWAEIERDGGAWLKIVPLDIPVREEDSAAFIDEYIDDLDQAGLDALNKATDDAFYLAMAHKPGYEIPSSQHIEAEAWIAMRREFMGRVVRLSNLPDSARTIFEQVLPSMPLGLPAPGEEMRLFENAEALIGIAKDLLQLSPTERAGFVAFAGRCDSVADLRGKLDEFLAAAEGREAASEDRFAKGEQIAGMAYEYDLAKKYLDGPVSAAALENILGPKLEAWGYTGTVRQMVDAFMADVEEYKAAFKKEAEQVALRGMAQFETEFDAVSIAMADDAAFAETFAECRDTCVAFLERTNNMGDNDYLFLELQALARGNPLLAQILDALGGNEPFGGNRSDTMGTFYEFFAMFDPDDPKAASKFKYELQKLVSKRRKGIEDSRKFIKEQDPEDFIWRTGAIQQNLQESGAKPSSIHAEIVGDELEKIADEELADALKLGAAAIAAGLLTMGTGTVAVIGATASFAISSYDAWETYNRYLQDEAGSNAGLIRTEPNFAWAVIAMVSVGPDAFEVVGVAAKVAKARRIKAIAELLDAETGDAVRAFNAADPEDLLEQI
ncbi:hypothetical protein Z945_3438 [Sulfitobacter noctilucae]|uniref:hypothetical protein n=1 Tax=Sulfitobacter noctilucae TaxID=1342302 RepID=UPI000469B7D2|nr:hypothetical protein [Sulfitobacter noctilucae]KIN70973.1 hypothetical protein Z945_3438 [Sulfitobacter noctilucae]